MGLISWIILGALSGWLASKIMKTDREQDAVGNIGVGIAGALLGGVIMNILNRKGVTGINLQSIVVATGGACLFIFLLKSLRNKSH